MTSEKSPVDRRLLPEVCNLSEEQSRYHAQIKQREKSSCVATAVDFASCDCFARAIAEIGETLLDMPFSRLKIDSEASSLPQNEIDCQSLLFCRRAKALMRTKHLDAGSASTQLARLSI